MGGQGAEYCGIPSILAAEDGARVGRLRRRVESTNLLILGIAASMLGLGSMLDQDGAAAFLPGLSIPAAFVVTAAVMHRRADRIGIRTRGAGYVPVAVASVVAVPWILAATVFVGGLTVLSAGFVLFGWRERCQRVWMTAAGGMLVGLATSAEFVRAVVPFAGVEGSVFVGVATAVFGVIATAIGVLGYIAESGEMADVG